MKKFFSWLIVLTVIVIALGFYRGWFAFSSNRDAESHNVDVRLTVDSDKVKQDAESVTGNSKVSEEKSEDGP